jgi:CelD/BcsL family acetyltransferase involved in cellulose biosynthesis
MLRLFDHMSAATWRGWPAVFFTLAVRRLKRAIKQSPMLWRMFGLARAAAWTLRRRQGDESADEPERAPPLAPQ